MVYSRVQELRCRFELEGNLPPSEGEHLCSPVRRLLCRFAASDTSLMEVVTLESQF